MANIGNIGGFLSRLRANAAKTRKTGTGEPPKATTGAQKRAPAASELQSIIRARIEAIDINNPEGLSRARRVFIEASLAWEFGETILLDPSFQELVGKVEADFESNRRLQEEFDGVICGLKK